MTKKTQPTDAELMEVIREAAKGSTINRDGSTSLRIARAVLAKWGTPAPVELEAELAAMRAGVGATKWRLHYHPSELPEGEAVDYPLQSGDFADGWTEYPLYTHLQPATQDAERRTFSDEELTAIYKEANNDDGKKAQPITTQRIFRAMRAIAAQQGDKT